VSHGTLLDAAVAAQAACDAAGLPNCIIGGIALQRWGEPRFTADVDLAVLVEAGQEAQATSALLARLPARVEDAAGVAARVRVVLAQTAAGVGVDIVLAGLDYEARVIERSTPWDIGGGTRLRTCSAEDLLVMKSFAGRDKDWADVTGILERQGRRLDLAMVRRELAPLVAAKAEPDLLAQLERRIAAHGL
jgi:hypothetical protein